MAVVRWIFDDPETLDSYTFEINPVENDVPAYEKNVNTLQPTAGNTIISEGTDQPRTGEFSGVILTEDMFNEMVTWFEKRYPITLTDDLSRSFTIYITQFDVTRERAVHSPWKHSYRVSYLLLEEL